MSRSIRVWWPAALVAVMLLVCLLGVAAAGPPPPTPTPTVPPLLFADTSPVATRDPRPLPLRPAAPPAAPQAPLADGYEPDNAPVDAKEFSFDWPEVRSIDPAGDDDWIRVTVEVASGYEFWAESSEDLVMWLYDAGLEEWDYSDDFGDTADPYIFGWCGQGALPAGEYYLLIMEYDDTNVVNPYELYGELSACEGDLTPVAQDGHEFPVVPNSIKGTKMSGSVLYANRPTYLDWFFQNIGDVDIHTPFSVEVWLDGRKLIDYPYNGYWQGGVGGFADWSDGEIGPGWHTLSIEVDPENEVIEFDESNNYWEKEFYWAEVTGWWGQYFNADEPGGDPVLVRDDAAIAFDWSNHSPGPGVNADFFSARWTRQVTFQAGVYLFHLVRDDGMRVWDDGAIIYDGWPDDVEQTSFTRVMTAGAHDLQVDFHERQGGAVARFWWERCYKVTTAASPANYGEVELEPSPNCGTGHYTAGTLVSVQATVNGANRFVNWSGDLSGAQNPQTLTINSDKSVTANFALPCYSLTRLVNPSGGGSIIPSPGSNCAGDKYTAGTTVSLEPDPAQYYVFANWSGDLSGTQKPQSVTMNGDRSVTANFTRPCYTLTLLVDPSGSGSIDPTPTPNCAGNKYLAGTTVSLQAAAASGYQFVNFSGAITGTPNPRNMIVDGNKTVTAHFSRLCYALTLAVAPGGSGSIDPTPDPNCAGGKYTAGTPVSLQATATSGYQFTNWAGALAGAQNPKSLTMNGDKSVTANFTRCYALTVTTDPPGLPVTLDISPPPTCGGRYVAGTAVTMALPPLPSGYTFIGWGGDVSGTQNPKTITMNSDKQVVIRLSRVCYTLTTGVTPGNGGSVLPSPEPNCGGNKYVAGTTVSLQANPAQYYVFANWSGDLSGAENPKSLTMNGDRSVTANFTRPCYTLTLAANPPGGGSIDPTPNPNCAGGKYTAGTTVSLLATPAADYHFASWSGDLIGAQNPSSVTVDVARSVIANFADDNAPCYPLTLDRQGEGDPLEAEPLKSPSCATAGSYVAGQGVVLMADAADGWRVTGWVGTDNDGTRSESNYLVMPAQAHTAQVVYGRVPAGEGLSFAPLIVKPGCVAGPGEAEPNDNEAGANGPLCSGVAYAGQADRYDVFYFEVGGGGNIVTRVTGYPQQGTQLQLYYMTTQVDPLDVDYNPADGLVVEWPNPAAGRYYLLLANPHPSPATYTLVATYPAR